MAHRTIGSVTTGASAGTGVAGALAVVLVWLLSEVGVDVPSEVSAAIAVLIAGVGTLVGGYLVPSKGDHEA